MGQKIDYTYDSGGNITQKDIYAYTSGTVGAFQKTVNYTYDSTWKDKLISYDGDSITYDAIGNPLTYRDDMSFTWQGRQMASANLDGTAVTYKYNADGLRTYKKVGSTVSEYEYLGDKLIYEKRGNIQFHYRYDAYGNLGSITRINAAGSSYTAYVVCNSRGDVEEIRKADGALYARYIYDSWGNTVKILDANGNTVTDPDYLSVQNPIRYRGYYYDAESGLYYLQSRYYDPVTGRFVNGDGYISTGTGVLGYNMFAYCENNPVKYKDTSGTFIGMAIGSIIGGIAGYIEAKRNNADVIKGTLIGAATGAISGLSVDAAIATGGVGGIVLAFAGGAISSALNYGLTEKANGNAVDTGEMVTEAIVGGAFNVLSFGIGDGSMKKAGGKLLKNMINNAKSTILENTTRLVRGKEVWKSNYGVVKNMAKNIMGEFMMSTTETVCSTVVLEVITYDGK